MKILIVVGLLMVPVLFVATQYRALVRCAPGNRAMRPWLVWLCLVPVLSFVWNAIAVARIEASLKAEFRARGWEREFLPTIHAGLGYSILFVAYFALKSAQHNLGMGHLHEAAVPLCGLLLTCWVLYWGMLAVDLRKLAAEPRRDRRGWEVVGDGGQETPKPPSGPMA